MFLEDPLPRYAHALSLSPDLRQRQISRCLKRWRGESILTKRVLLDGFVLRCHLKTRRVCHLPLLWRLCFIQDDFQIAESLRVVKAALREVAAHLVSIEFWILERIHSNEGLGWVLGSISLFLLIAHIW